MSTVLLALATPMASQKFLTASGVYPLLLIPAIVGMRGSSQPSTTPSSTMALRYLLDITVLVKFSLANSICCGGADHQPTSFKTQSYKGLWSSNSSVQMECVIPSMASSIGWAKSYIGYMHHLSLVLWCETWAILYIIGSLMLMLGEAMSILALSTFSPSLYLPSFISSNSLRFSSTLLFL